MPAAFTPKRRELIAALRETGPLTVAELARRLGRDDKNVHTDAMQRIEWMAVERADDGRVNVPVGDRGGYEVAQKSGSVMRFVPCLAALRTGRVAHTGQKRPVGTTHDCRLSLGLTTISRKFGCRQMTGVGDPFYPMPVHRRSERSHEDADPRARDAA